MKVITNAPIFYSSAEGIYSSALGKTVPEIKEFQSWHNVHKDAKDAVLIVDGKLGKNTIAAYKKYSALYDGSLSIPSKPKTSKVKDKLIENTETKKQEDSKEAAEVAPIGMIGKFKALSTPKKIAIIAVPLLIIAGIIYYKKKHSK